MLKFIKNPKLNHINFNHQEILRLYLVLENFEEKYTRKKIERTSIRKYKTKKILTKIKVNKLFLYFTLNLFHLFLSSYIKIKSFETIIF